MKRSRLEKDKNIEDNMIKDVRNLFRLKKENKAIKDKKKLQTSEIKQFLE